MKTEDILKHYGVKGMKWDKTKVDPEIQALIDARDQNVKDIQDVHSNIEKRLSKTGSDLEKVSNLLRPKKTIKKELVDLKDAVKDKIGSVSKDVKKKGYNILLKMFGPAKKTSTITTYIESPNKRR